jgi:hypothetical protein
MEIREDFRIGAVHDAIFDAIGLGTRILQVSERLLMKIYFGRQTVQINIGGKRKPELPRGNRVRH